MKLHEIIETIDDDISVSYEEVQPYRKSLKTYYAERWCSAPKFMVLFLTNSICAGKIVPSDQFDEALRYESDRSDEREIITFNSFFL